MKKNTLEFMDAEMDNAIVNLFSVCLILFMIFSLSVIMGKEGIIIGSILGAIIYFLLLLFLSLYPD